MPFGFRYLENACLPTKLSAIADKLGLSVWEIQRPMIVEGGYEPIGANNKPRGHAKHATAWMQRKDGQEGRKQERLDGYGLSGFVVLRLVFLPCSMLERKRRRKNKRRHNCCIWSKWEQKSGTTFLLPCQLSCFLFLQTTKNHFFRSTLFTDSALFRSIHTIS